jgi:hypothetical protein
VQPGSVSFVLHFGSSINLNLHFHVVFLEGVYLDRSDADLKPGFVKAEPPSDADIAMVLQKISHRVIRKLRRLGYLEAGMDVAVATGYDLLLDNEPELARSMAASVRQRIAFGERAGEKVRRIGSGFGYERAALLPSAHAVAEEANGLNSKAPVVPVSMAFPCMPTPIFRRIGVIS